MDFDMIEGLSDEEVTSLYGDAIIDGIEDGVHMGFCLCYTGSGYVDFGYASYGYCTLLQQHARSQEACSAWCQRHGFTLNYFNTRCYCLRYGQYGGTYGWLDRCTG